MDSISGLRNNRSSIQHILRKTGLIKGSFEKVHVVVLPNEIIIEIPDEGLAVRYFDPAKASIITPYSDISKLSTKIIGPKLSRQIIHRIEALPAEKKNAPAKISLNTTSENVAPRPSSKEENELSQKLYGKYFSELCPRRQKIIDTHIQLHKMQPPDQAQEHSLEVFSCPICAKSGVRGKWQVLHETENFEVILDEFPIARGHILIAPKAHILSMSQLTQPQLKELDKTHSDIKDLLARSYDKDVIFFEHGSTTLDDEKALQGGKCVTHAHIHAIPVPKGFDIFDILKRNPSFRIESVASFNDLPKQVGEDTGYLFYENGKGEKFIIKWDDSFKVPSQYLRIIIAEALGNASMGDWKDANSAPEDIYAEWYGRALEDLQKGFTDYGNDQESSSAATSRVLSQITPAIFSDNREIEKTVEKLIIQHDILFGVRHNKAVLLHFNNGEFKKALLEGNEVNLYPMDFYEKCILYDAYINENSGLRNIYNELCATLEQINEKRDSKDYEGRAKADEHQNYKKVKVSEVNTDDFNDFVSIDVTNSLYGRSRVVIGLAGKAGSGKSVFTESLLSKIALQGNRKAILLRPGVICRFLTHLALVGMHVEETSSVLDQVSYKDVGGQWHLFYQGTDIDITHKNVLFSRRVTEAVANYAPAFQNAIIGFHNRVIKDMAENGMIVIIEGREHTLLEMDITDMIVLTGSPEKRAKRKLYELVFDALGVVDNDFDEALKHVARHMNAFPELTLFMIDKGLLDIKGKDYDEIVLESIGLLNPLISKRIEGTLGLGPDLLDKGYLAGPFRNKDTRGKPEWDNSIRYLTKFIETELRKISAGDPKALPDNAIMAKKEECVRILHAMISMNGGSYFDNMPPQENVASVQRIVKLVVFGDPTYSKYDENPEFRITGAAGNTIAKKALKGSAFQEMADRLHSTKDDPAEMSRLLTEICKVMVYVATPNVNFTNLDFIKDEDKAIRFVRDSIIKASEQKMSFNSIRHFVDNVLLSKTPKTIVFLPDDCGDSISHLYMIQTYLKTNPKLRFIIMPKSRQYWKDMSYNDLMETLARDDSEGGLLADLKKFIAEGRIIISNQGPSGAGINLEDLTDEAHEIFRKADVVMSVGQTYFETLNGLKKPIYHMFSVESIIATSITGAPQRSLVFANTYDRYYHVYDAEGNEPIYTLADTFAMNRQRAKDKKQYDDDHKLGCYSEIDIADFTNPNIATDDELCGPKGAMLADMNQVEGVNVSPGFTVTGAAYDLFRKQNNINELLDNMHRMAAEWIAFEISGEKDKKEAVQNRLLELAGILRDKIKEGNFTQEIYDKVKMRIEKYEFIFPGLTFAVRSSAVKAEDLEDSSFAGQQDSFVYQKGLEKVMESVKKCFASVFSNKAIVYRMRIQAEIIRKAGIQPDPKIIAQYLSKDDLSSINIKMAVVVQKMVENIRASGVVFSVNPESGDALIRVESTIGAGSNVDGIVTPDFWLVDPVKWEVVHRQMGDKTKKLVPDKNHAKVEHTTMKERKSYSLTDEEAVAIAKQIWTLRERFQKSRGWKECESEFAVTNEERIYLNQIRRETFWSKTEGEKNLQKCKIVNKAAAQTARKIISNSGMRGYISAFSGKVRIVENLEQFLRANNEIGEDDIVVAAQTNNSWNTLLLRSAGILSEMGGLTSHAAIVSREWQKPALIGVPDIVEVLKPYEGKWVTVDVVNLAIYEGRLLMEEAEVDFTKIPKASTDAKQLSVKALREHRRYLARKGGYTDKNGVWMKSPRHPLGKLVMGIFKSGYEILSKRCDIPMRTKIEKPDTGEATESEDLLWVLYDDRDALLEAFDTFSLEQIKKIFFDKLYASQEFVAACGNQAGVDYEGVERWIKAYKNHMSYRHMQWNFTYMLAQRLKEWNLDETYIDAMVAFLRSNGLPENIDSCYRYYKPFPLETEKYINTIERICDLCKEGGDFAGIKPILLSEKSDKEVLQSLKDGNNGRFLKLVMEASMNFKVSDSTDPRIKAADITERLIHEIRMSFKTGPRAPPVDKRTDLSILKNLTEEQRELLMYAVLDSIEKDNALHVMVRNQAIYINKLYELADSFVKGGSLKSREDILELSEEGLLNLLGRVDGKQAAASGFKEQLQKDYADFIDEISSGQLEKEAKEYYNGKITAGELQKIIRIIFKKNIYSVVADKNVILIYFAASDGGFKKMYLTSSENSEPRLVDETFVRESRSCDCIPCTMLLGLRPMWAEDVKETMAIFATENFVVRFDDHPISEGHMLVIPKTHVASDALLSKELLEELEYVKEKIAYIIKEAYGNEAGVLVFEHGSIGVSDAKLLALDDVKDSSSINHAHLHVVPILQKRDFANGMNSDIMHTALPASQDVHFQRVGSFAQAVNRLHLKSTKYLYYEDPFTKDAYCAVNLTPEARQFMRLAAGVIIGKADTADWRKGIKSAENKIIYNQWLDSAKRKLLPLFMKMDLSEPTKSIKPKSSASLLNDINVYIDKNKQLFADALSVNRPDTLLRIPIEAIESTGAENIKYFLTTFQESPNGYIELYHMSGTGEVSEKIYQKYGLQKKPLPKDFNRIRENTVTLFPSLKGEEINQSTIVSRLGSLDMAPENTIISPIGLQHDSAGLIRATILGLKMMDIARQIKEKGIGITKDQAFKDKIQLEILEQLKNVCDVDDFNNFNLTPDDIIALATGTINDIITALKKLTKLLPITPINPEDLKRIYEHAKQALTAADTVKYLADIHD